MGVGCIVFSSRWTESCGVMIDVDIDLALTSIWAKDDAEIDGANRLTEMPANHTVFLIKTRSNQNQWRVGPRKAIYRSNE